MDSLTYNQTNTNVDVIDNPDISNVDVLHLTTADNFVNAQSSCTDANISDTFNNNFEDDEVNSEKFCSNCLINFGTNELIKMDECDHFLCLNCRFMIDNFCKLCNRSFKNSSSTVLDLRKGCDNDFNLLENTCDEVCKEKDGEVPKKAKSKRIKVYRLPDYIDVLPRGQNNETRFQCSICKNIFTRKLQAKYHEACFTGERPLKCDICEKTFISNSHLKYHQHTHSGDRPFKCDLCGKTFIQKSKLNRHMSIHFDKKCFRCQFCDLGFSSKQSLVHHVRTHVGDRPFKCETCQRNFTTKLNLKRHELGHAGVKNYICEDCGKGFVLKHNLQSHRITHTNNRSHSCKECGFSFYHSKDLMRHMLVHADTERDYECSICIITFRRKDNLERHMRNIHPETITKYGKPQHIVSVVKVNNNIKLNVGRSKPISATDQKCPDTQTAPDKIISDKVNAERKTEVVNKLKNNGCKEMNSNVDRIQRTNVGDKRSDTNNVQSSKPKPQRVSVISSTKNVSNNVTKVSKGVEKSKNKSKTIPAYRLITPPVKPVDSNNGSSVPTITKVTHIVHTSNTGVSNVKTLITTRSISEKSTKKVKEKETPLSTKQPDKTENKKSETTRVGVIKYAITRNNKNTTETKHKCYRILKPDNNNQHITTCSSSSICSNNTNSSIVPQLNDSENSVLSKSVSGADVTILYDNYQQSNVLPSSDSNNMLDERSNILNNASYSNATSQVEDMSVNTDSILTKSLPQYGDVSDSCLLADNALDDNIAASLYLEEENNREINNVYETEEEPYMSNRSNDALGRENILNYSWNLVNNEYNQNGKSALQDISNAQDEVNENQR